MSSETKVFNYEVDGLSYTVTVYEENGEFLADINVLEGHMDVNAVYYGDDDMSGKSESLSGPLNMNGGGSQYEGEKVQWDQADALSKPGLGREGEEKETFLSEGDTLTLSLTADSLDDIDFFGIRATSTSTDEGSIKAVSGDPQDQEPEPEEETFDKTFFVYESDENGLPTGGFNILSEEPEENPFNIPVLPEGTEPTFENHVNYFEEIGGDVTQTESVIFYNEDADGVAQEVFSIEAPEGGFADSGELLEAYDAAIAEMETEGAPEEVSGEDLIALLSLEPLGDEDATSPEAETSEDDPMIFEAL